MNNKNTEQILKNTFSLEFPQAKLTQKNGEPPRVCKGPANITQLDDGRLVLKLNHLYGSRDEVFEEFNTSIFNRKKFQLGQIIDDHHYFDFEGVDISGDTWTSSRIWISGDVDISSNSKVVTAPLQSIETFFENTTASQETVNAQLYIPGKCNIPCPANNLSIAGRSCVLEQHDSYLEIIADLTGEPDPDNHLNLILEGLSIGLGYYLRPRLKNVNYSGRQIQIIYSSPKDQRQLKLPPPIPTSHPHNSENLQVFLSKFIAAIDKCHSPLVGYWFRVLQAFEGDVENSALVLTIAVEGLLKNYYKSTSIPDKEFIQQLKEAKSLIKALPLGERAQSYLMRSLGNAKRTSPKNSLYKLVEAKLISEDMVVVWTNLRSKSAHADELKFEAHELQAFVDERNVCLELLYRLVLGKISYSGEIVQYSIKDWPHTDFPCAISE